MTDELRPAYRTLNEPTRLLGLPIGAWAAVLAVGTAGYVWLQISPLPWRLNFSLVAVGLGAPAALLVLREQGTIGPARLVAGVIAWRSRPAIAVTPSATRPVRTGGVRLDTSFAEEPSTPPVRELPWTEDLADSGPGHEGHR